MADKMKPKIPDDLNWAESAAMEAGFDQAMERVREAVERVRGKAKPTVIESGSNGWINACNAILQEIEP